MIYIASSKKAGFRVLKISFALAIIDGLVFAGGMQIFNLPSGVQKAQAADTGFKTTGSIVATGSWTGFTMDKKLLTQFYQPFFKK